jgi:hypothetical protein
MFDHPKGVRRLGGVHQELRRGTRSQSGLKALGRRGRVHPSYRTSRAAEAPNLTSPINDLSG